MVKVLQRLSLDLSYRRVGRHAETGSYLVLLIIMKVLNIIRT